MKLKPTTITWEQAEELEQEVTSIIDCGIASDKGLQSDLSTFVKQLKAPRSVFSTLLNHMRSLQDDLSGITYDCNRDAFENITEDFATIDSFLTRAFKATKGKKRYEFHVG